MRILKKIDKLVMVSFIPPFILAFCIAIFVLVMQFLWSFIDEIVGKGIDTLVLFEMIFYRSLSLFPLALPIGVLLASVMVFGNLSERYELSSMKSAGISLLRIMFPVIIISTGVALFSFYCSNTLIPLSNLKFQSRLYDIRNQKPALSLEEGIFNDDFADFTIRIGKKDADNITIHDVLIYDQSSSARRNFHLVMAERGEMFVSEEDNAFVMRLFDGVQYQEPEESGKKQDHPFVRTRFSQWQKNFDLSQFDLSSTPEEAFQTHHTMKSVPQLAYEIDSIAGRFGEAVENNQYLFSGIIQAKQNEHPLNDGSEAQDSFQNFTIVDKDQRTRPVRREEEVFAIIDSLQSGVAISHFYQVLTPKQIRQTTTKAEPSARRSHDQAYRLEKTLESLQKSLSSHTYELHFKFSIAVVCILFLFIGGPMGAIVRKGGFGYPLLIAIGFFTLYIILNLTFKKLAEAGSADATFAAWIPTIGMLPISIYLTYKALYDSKMLDFDKYVKPIQKLFARDEKVVVENP